MTTSIYTQHPTDLPAVDPLDMLVVAPHPDDAELGMGGTIAKMTDQGWRVGVLDLTSGEPTPHGSEATFVLGIGLHDRPNIGQRTPLESSDPISAGQVGTRSSH